MKNVVVEPEELTSTWLSQALGDEVEVASVEPVGTGQIGSCFRVILDDGDRLLAKLPAADPALRSMLAGAYAAEVRFYTEIAPTVDAYRTIRPAGRFEHVAANPAG